MLVDYTELNNELQGIADQTEVEESDLSFITDEYTELEQRWLDEQSFCVYSQHDHRYQTGG